MSYRILCDEHVAPQTARYLNRSGHDAIHIQDALSLGIDDDAIADYAIAENRALLTNDRGFLDRADYPDLTVLCYTDNRATAYELTATVEAITDYYPAQEDLPQVLFLP